MSHSPSSKGRSIPSHINFVAPVFSKKIAGQKYELTRPLDLDSPGARRALRLFKERGTVVDPTLAVETAEAMSEAAGQVTDDAKALFQRALDTAPPNAPWRVMAQRRLSGALS